ncbi:hypothetical protein MKW94_006696 [Papaver nudicaule]|uniref:Uncharacterized protein n=1 Tax=Papaver nudicaule TaxID=74823 RepID=A0AA42AUE9_PAPNU|nr:hypothetical protein [Papaver nudicaule]
MAPKIALILGFVIASILLQSMCSNALPHLCTGYEGYVPWDGGEVCGGIAIRTAYQEYAYQDCGDWCLRTEYHYDHSIKCAQITYEEETNKHACTCWTECIDR